MLHYSVLPASSERPTVHELGDLHFALVLTRQRALETTVTAERSRLVIDLPAWVGETAVPGRACRDDQAAMALVIRLAEENVARGDGGPFGAAVFEIGSGVLVAAGVNRVIEASNSVLHAEMVALMFAQQRRRPRSRSARPAVRRTSWSRAASRARCAWARRSGAA